MSKLLVLVPVLGLAALAGPQHPVHEPIPRWGGLKEEKIVIELTTGVDEAVVIVEAEAEVGLERVDVYEPSGAALLGLDASRTGGRALQGFVVETRESDLSTLLQQYPEGVYELRARTVDGAVLSGSARLDHALPPRPVLLYPFEGAVDVPRNLTVLWLADPSAAGFHVVLEQGENDGLSVFLPPGTSSFTVPSGVLAPATDTLVEVAVIAANGNRTLTEVEFTTH